MREPSMGLTLSLSASAIKFSTFVPTRLFSKQAEGIRLLSIKGSSVSIMVRARLGFVEESAAPDRRLRGSQPTKDTHETTIIY